MILNEFSLIDTYFKQQTHTRPDVWVGIGDDAALLQVPAHHILAVSVDTLIAGVHFPLTTSPADIGYKALAVNLSDLAAMGAEPAWMTLALTLPQADQEWLHAFATGLFELAHLFNVQLVGGDTTRGPLSITLQIQGFLPPQIQLLRRGAQVGDKIYVSNTLGDAGLGLQVALGKKNLPPAAADYVLARLNRPTPRIELGLLLRSFAHSAIDISDGLLADLQHILTSSQVGAKVYAQKLPLSPVLHQHTTPEEAIMLALTAGDDYELCFTVAPNQEQSLLEQLNKQAVKCHCIGEMTAGTDLEIIGAPGEFARAGYQHF